MGPRARLIEAILRSPGTVVMLGAADVGKTTTATALVNAALHAGYATAVVDADTGQSDIGPPATVGLATPLRPARRMDQWAAAAAFFVGDTSPPTVQRYLLEGVDRAVARAREWGAGLIAVDTTGWIEGDAAVACKLEKLRRVRPRHVVALQRDGEAERILAHLPAGVMVHRLRPSRWVRHRSREARRAARAGRYHRYFLHARPHAIALGEVPGARLPVYLGRRIPQRRMLRDIPEAARRHLLVGLADEDGWLVAVGSLVGATVPRQVATVMAPLRSLAGVAALQWGVLRVAPSGVEEGRLL